ncbi:hypothetical protein U9M48_023410 [Paspalum notatum var. saurae]|uniref:Uncharacterized protein n=1 Tax=Paspalum notatum var. saurae TaxID=547442 RepID=A0AAQ3TPF7_PASNO
MGRRGSVGRSLPARTCALKKDPTQLDPAPPHLLLSESSLLPPPFPRSEGPQVGPSDPSSVAV